MLLAGAGALGLLLAATGANAQDFTGLMNGAPAPQTAPASSPDDSRAIVIDRTALREDGVLQPLRHEGQTNFGVMTLEDYRRRFPNRGDEDFYRIERENETSCQRSAAFVARSLDLVERLEANGGRWTGLRARMPDLERAANGATWWRRLMGVGAVVISGGAAAPGVLAYEGQGIAHDRHADANREMMDASAELSQISVDAHLLDQEARMWWYADMDEHCRAMGIYDRITANYRQNPPPAQSR